MANHPKHNQSGRRSKRNAKTGLGQNRSASHVRIVAGDWRGRKIPVVQADGLRPTGDRVRETLFNWLQLSIPGSRCLDLYAGSGALGFEAVSRGAAGVTLVESSPEVVRQLHQTLSDLGGSDKVQLYGGKAEQFLHNSTVSFDVVFVDPPFELQAHLRILEALSAHHLVDGALLYVELPTAQDRLVENLPGSFSVHKRKRFGDVTALLLQFNVPEESAAVVAP